MRAFAGLSVRRGSRSLLQGQSKYEKPANATVQFKQRHLLIAASCTAVIH